MENARTRLRILFEGQTENFSSEKFEAEGGIAVATLTSGESFAAEKGRFGTGREF